MIVNINRDRYEVYIGRRRDRPHFGNPFSHAPGTLAVVRVETRDEAIQAFEDWLTGKKHQEIEPLRRDWILSNLWRLKGKVLGCYCAPKRCHGEVLERLANG